LNRLRQHDTVLITLPRGTDHGFEAVVLAFSERGMTLQARDKVRLVRLPDVVPGAFVTFRHEKSLVALPGTLFCVKPVGDLRFQVSEASLYRSRGTRLKYVMPIAVREAGSSVDISGATVDVGPDGLLIECATKATLGDRVTVSFAGPHGDEPVGGAAQVVRVGPGMLAVRLPPESTAVRNALGEIVVAQSRAELTRETAKVDVSPDF
jgi:hypothetical protein